MYFFGGGMVPIKIGRKGYKVYSRAIHIELSIRVFDRAKYCPEVTYKKILQRAVNRQPGYRPGDS